MPVPALLATLGASLIVLLAGALVTAVVAVAAPDLLKRVDRRVPTAVVGAMGLAVVLAMLWELLGLGA
ncbi:hypothetical protein [Limnochorda pilosa]|uniref:Uncharacterized protein n=1 Tax=Limnochorda pilosa TaxID=1555112 RepID=A0A0K2SP22_LIMPI|nr:hypothetical protein [Limnochorda pilosa]BAS28865.1 hypothetical protein LIP_3036 [Limnochorda pilosa]